MMSTCPAIVFFVLLRGDWLVWCGLVCWSPGVLVDFERFSAVVMPWPPALPFPSAVIGRPFHVCVGDFFFSRDDFLRV